MAEPGIVCEVCLHAHGYQGAGSYQHLGDYLLNLPGIRVEGHTFLMEDAHSSLILAVTPGHAKDMTDAEMVPGPDITGRFDRIVIFARSLPEGSACKRFADFCFSLARWTGWPVYDVWKRPLKDERALLKLLQMPPERTTPVASSPGWTVKDTDALDWLLRLLDAASSAGCGALLLLLGITGTWAARALLHR